MCVCVYVKGDLFSLGVLVYEWCVGREGRVNRARRYIAVLFNPAGAKCRVPQRVWLVGLVQSLDPELATLFVQHRLTTIVVLGFHSVSHPRSMQTSKQLVDTSNSVRCLERTPVSPACLPRKIIL